MEQESINDIRLKIDEIHKKVIHGKITLLNYELVPIFNSLKDSLNTNNLDIQSKVYKNACNLLNQKFIELKNLLSTSNTEKNLIEYLKSTPNDNDIAKLFQKCWKRPFTINSLSLNYLESSKNKLCIERNNPQGLEQIDFEPVDDTFILEVSKFSFTEKMMEFFERIKKSLPCTFNKIFENETEEVVLCENFVYLMHLIQSNIVKFEKDTNILYTERVD